MGSVNKCQFIGNLTRDPDVTHLSDVKVANFTIACNESWKDQKTGEWKEKVEFVRIVAWRYLAEKTDNYLRKGKQVYVDGRLETRKWQDKEGNDKYTTEIIAKDIQLLGKKDDFTDEEKEQLRNPRVETVTPEEEDLPF